jgi:hypothetical protein
MADVAKIVLGAVGGIVLVGFIVNSMLSKNISTDPKYNTIFGQNPPQYAKVNEILSRIPPHSSIVEVGGNSRRRRSKNSYRNKRKTRK